MSLADNGIGIKNLELALAALTLTNQMRWGRDISVAWVHADEAVAPAALTALVTRTVGAGKVGYIYGFFIEAQEANDFLIGWVSGGAAKQKRVTFAGGGAEEAIDPVALNEGLPADAATDITIKNVNVGVAGKVYQAALLYGEV